MGFQVVFYQLLLTQPNLGFIRPTFVFSGAIAWEARLSELAERAATLERKPPSVWSEVSGRHREGPEGPSGDVGRSPTET